MKTIFSVIYTNTMHSPSVVAKAVRMFGLIGSICGVLLWAGAAQAAYVPAVEQSESMYVGSVSLVLGKAFLESQDAAITPISIGTRIRATDRIHTTANGHVHIRFVDAALVSVRPDSILEIVRYDYNEEQPQLSFIKLSLEEGVTRAISGKGASAAREGFRLNTPVAAIGVRGTDFVVSTTQQTVQALVNEGAIIMAPFSEECSSDTFGPCALNAVELTESSLQIIEFDGTGTSPRLLPAPHERDPALMSDEVQVAVSVANERGESDDKTAGADYLENVTSIKVTDEVANVVLNKPVEYTPTTALSASSVSKDQLVWGRWANGQGTLERLAVSQDIASAGREVTVGNIQAGYFLYRDESTLSGVQPGLGNVSFSLDSAQAFYHSDSGVVAMTVEGGSLGVNFNTNSFATALNMNNALTGDVDFNATGTLSTEGFFNSRTDTERLTGAVSFDGTEAGYYFKQDLLNGNIQGLTLWDRP